jgi:hypothetical protein
MCLCSNFKEMEGGIILEGEGGAKHSSTPLRVSVISGLILAHRVNVIRTNVEAALMEVLSLYDLQRNCR